MATEADNIPAAICETKRELGETTNNSTNTLPQEENTQADTPDEPPTVDGDTKFLKTHTIGEVYSQVNYISPNASKVTNDNEPAVIDKDEDLKRVELFGNEKNNTVAFMKEETEKPAESLHIVPDHRSTFNLSQDNDGTISSVERSTNVNIHGITSDIREGKDTDPLETQKEVFELSLRRIVSCSPEEGSTNAVLVGAISDSIDVKTIDKVDIQQGVPENLSTVGLNEEMEEKSVNEVDVPDTKAEENLEKEGEKIFSPQSLARDASDNETVVMHESRIEDGELRKHETGEIEKCTETMLLEKELKMKKPKDSLIAACEETKASKLAHGTDNIGSFEEQSAITNPREILDGKTGDEALDAAETTKEILENIHNIASNRKTEELSLIQVDDPQEKNREHLAKDSEKPSLIKDSGQQIETSSFKEQSRTTYSQTEGALDAAETKEEILENVSTIASHGKTEKNNLLIQVDSPQKKIEEHLEKNSEKPSLIKDFVGNVNDDESTVLDDVKPEEVSKKEENIESYMLKEEMHIEKPLQSFTAVLGDKASDLGQDTETTGIHEDHSLTENRQGILSEKPEEETTDAADTKKKTEEQQQNIAVNVSNEDNDKNSSIQLDVSQMKHATLLKNDIENPPSVESSSEDINDESTIMHESRRKVGLPESDKYTDSTLLNLGETHEDRKPIASTEDIETTCSPHEQRLITNPPICETDTKEHAATKSLHEHTERILAIQVECSYTEHGEHLEKEGENSSHLTEAPVEETRDNKSKLHESRDGGEIEAEFLENEINTVSTSVKEDAHVEKHTVSLQAAPDDIKASDSTHDIKMSSIGEEILTACPLSNDEKEEIIDGATDMKTHQLQDIAKNNPDGYTGNNSIIEEDSSEKQSSKEISLEKSDDNVSAVMHEEKLAKEHLIKADLLEKEKHKGTLVKEEAYALVQDTEKSYLEEQRLDAESQRIMVDRGKTNDVTNTKKEFQKDKQNAATTTSYEDSEKNSQIQVDVPQLQDSKHLEKESESTQLTEARPRDTAKNILVNEQAEMEYVEASASVQDIETNSIKEQIPTVNLQEISSYKIKEKTTDAAYPMEKTLDDVAIYVPNRDHEDNSAVEVDCLQKPFLTEASTGNINDDESTNMHEVKRVDENLRRLNLFENKKNIECTLVEKEVSIEASKEAGEGFKACASCQHRETSPDEQDLTRNPQRTMDDKEDNTIDATNLKEETPKEKNVAIIPHEVTRDESVSQVESSQMEQKEDFKKESKNTSLAESQGGTIDSTLNEEALAEKSVDCFLTETGDMKASASGQVTETSSEEQISPANPQEIYCDKIDEKSTDSFYEQEELVEDIVTYVPSEDKEDNSPVEVYGRQEPSLKEYSIGNSNYVEPPIIHEPKFEDENLVKADLQDNEKDAESIPGKGKVSIETSFLEVESLTTNSQEIMSHHKEDKTIDETELAEETHQDEFVCITLSSFAKFNPSNMKKVYIFGVSGYGDPVRECTVFWYVRSGSWDEGNIAITTPCEEAEKILIQANFFLTAHSGHLENESGNSSLTRDQTGNTTESSLLKEGSATEKLIGSAQAPMENIKASSQVTDSIEQQILTVDPQEISGDTIKERFADVADKKEIQDTAINFPSCDKEDSSSTKVNGLDDQSLTKTSTGNLLSFREKTSTSVDVSTPSTKDLGVNTDKVVDVVLDPKCTQEKSCITTALEEYMMMGVEHVANVVSVTSSASEQSVQNSDKTDTEKMTVLDDGSTKIPTNENLVETDPTGSIKEDIQVADEENKAELKQQDTETRAYQDVSDSYNSVVLEDIASFNVTSEKHSTSNPSRESRNEGRKESENEEAQKQDEDVNVSIPVQDSSIEEMEKDVHSCPASTTDSEIIRDMQNENTINNTYCIESEVAEDATKSFLNDKKITEGEQNETECKQENVVLDEEVEENKDHASIPVPIDFLPESFTETSEVDHSTAERQMTTNKEDLQAGKTPTDDKEKTKLEKDKEEESDEQKISYFSFEALNIIETGGRNGAGRSIADVEAKIDDEVPRSTESQEVGSGSVRETSASMYRCERDGYEHAHISTKEKQNSNEVGYAPEESNTGYEARNQVLEYQVQHFGMISKAEESVDQAAAAELKSETVLAEDRFQPTETMKVHISSEKINEGDEEVQNDHLGSCKEEVITENQVSEDPEEAVGKVAEEPEEKLQEANESITSSLQKEQGKCVENAAKISVTGEIHVHIGPHDSEEVVNRSTVAFQEDEDKSTRADDVDNEMAKEKGFRNQNTNISVEDPALGEQSKRPDENIMCGAPSTKTLHITAEDAEGNKEMANTIMIQHQVDERRSKQENSPLPEFIQGIESEKQAKKVETCSSDEVQIKHEIKAGILRKPTEDEEKKTYVESEKVDFSCHADDTAKDVPADNENSTTKNENQEIKVPCEGQEPEAIQKGSASETLKQEVQLERNSEPATKAKEVNSPEVEIIDDDCYDLIGNSSTAGLGKIAESNADQSSEDKTRSDKIQESQRQIESLPIVPVTKCSDVEVPEKDLPVQFAGLDSISGTELTVTPIPSNYKHTVFEADHTKNTNSENLTGTGNTNISLIEDEHSAKCSEGDHELPKNPVVEPGRASCEHEEQTTQETTKSTQKSEQTAKQYADEKEQTPRSEDLQAEKSDEVDHKDTKTDEGKYDEQESSEQKISELCSEAPIMVDMGDADEKVAHRKSHNILSGVGSKVKHSIAKVKKAITGKSPHTKPSSPK
ncbi:hypothetical protein OROGR_006779 [Orobanche gracilis]